ncbi:RND transporter [Dokdonia pacifica]|uniref:RND family efflux transporter, MFP subunit n=1 Tax=Dokdonia pacifica TaxID=1627892 RepID=A0A239A9T5_9FLAO|nr:efflux RND transporter periplasmic adaptor subunit [Dokdonia pacifica]GGG35656.1 RND transporter [Dokdonia pacifica]SNR92162.1 RND family efflux transporter, MFP subunit [Dokdonia pacifica]
MKNLLSIVTIALVIASCGGDKGGTSVESIIETGNIEALKAKKAELSTKAATIATELDQIEKAIAEKDPTAKKEVLVTTMAVKDTLFNHYVEIQGNVETKQNVLVYPEYQGTLLRVNVKEGQRVSKGQVLGRIDDGGLSSQLAQLETQAALAKTTFERQERLWNQKIGSEIQYLQSKSQYESAENMVNQMKSQLGKTAVRAPFTGVIDEVITEQGTVVAPGMALFRIVNLNNMYVSAEVPETYLTTVRKGKDVRVFFPVLNETIEAKIRQAGDYINPSNRSFPIEVAVPNKTGNIKPNLTARLSINDYTVDNAILIPLNVINENAEGEQYVYTAFAKADNNTTVAKQQIITTGKSQGDKIEVLSGLKSGDLIIVEGARSVKDNQEVRILTY